MILSPGIPHSIQGLDPDGCEFLLAFDDGEFDEDSTFRLSDGFKHIPPDILTKNIQAPVSTFSKLPSPENEYIFAGTVPGSLNADAVKGAAKSKIRFTHRMMAQAPIKAPGGTKRITDSSVFPVSKTTAALVDIDPAACASCTGLRTTTSGSIIWRGKAEWVCCLLGAGKNR